VDLARRRLDGERQEVVVLKVERRLMPALDPHLRKVTVELRRKD
jgi:hypothetical protein